MDSMVQDLRIAFRSLRRAPGFTLVAALTLALGIGANTAIFSVLYGVLLRPLPYPEPDRLAGFQQVFRGSTGGLAVTYRQYAFLAEHGTIFTSLAASTEVGFNLATGATADRLDGLRVSRDYFQVLGVEPVLGRGFTAEEDREGGPSAVILSHAVWQRHFAGDRTVLGRDITMDGRPFTVVGVMPAEFRSNPDAQVWTTLAQVSRTIGSGGNLGVIGRLRPGVSWAQARAAFGGTDAAYNEEFRKGEEHLGLAPLRDTVTWSLRTPVRLLFGAIGLVLLIACANVANLALGRAAGRSREMAVRIAVGATRGRLVRQLMTESVLLALLGGAAGLLLATWGLSLLLAMVPPSLASGADIRTDGWALGFAVAVSLATGVLFGLAPAWQVTSTQLHEALKDAGGRTTGAAGHHRLRSVLIVGEMAVSLVLLVGAGLLIRTFGNLVREDAGFDPRRVVSAEIWLTGSRYDSTAKIAGFYRSLTERLGAIPGVQSVAVVEAGLPLQRGGNMGVSLDGQYLQSQTNYRTITPGYFTTLGVTLARGRFFSDADAGSAPPVTIVSALFAQRHLGGSDAALGRMVHVGGTGGTTSQVVGVVGDVKQFIGDPAIPTVFLPSAQTPANLTRVFNGWFPIHVLVRTAGDPVQMQPLIERTIREADAQVPLGRVRAMREVLAGSLAMQRFVMLLLAAFASLAMLLAAVGIYGVISYLVAQRTHEIGVRMALGARSADVLRMVLRRGLVLAGVGAALGIAGAVALTRLLGNLLYDVRPTDLPTYAGVTVLLVGVALAACWVPARRAATVDPMIALRSE